MATRRKRLGCILTNKDFLKSDLWKLAQPQLKHFFTEKKRVDLKNGYVELWGYSEHFPYRGYETSAEFKYDSFNGGGVVFNGFIILT